MVLMTMMRIMGGTQVQSLTPTPLKHPFGPLQGGAWVGGGHRPKTTPFSELPWCPGSIHAQGNLADHIIMISCRCS